MIPKAKERLHGAGMRRAFMTIYREQEPLVILALLVKVARTKLRICSCSGQHDADSSLKSAATSAMNRVC